MWRSSIYNISQASLEYFAKNFNSLPNHPNVKWLVISEESYNTDGFFIDLQSGRTIGFDWEIRDSHFVSDEFPFKTLSAFERKIKKPSLKLIIECNKPMTAIVSAWVQDYKAEEKVTANLEADGRKQQDGERRLTDKFILYKLNELYKFKDMVAYALENEIYDYRAFNFFDKASEKINTQPFNEVDSESDDFQEKFREFNEGRRIASAKNMSSREETIVFSDIAEFESNIPEQIVKMDKSLYDCECCKKKVNSKVKNYSLKRYKHILCMDCQKRENDKSLNLDNR